MLAGDGGAVKDLHRLRPHHQYRRIGARLAAVVQGGEIVISETTLARLGQEAPVEDPGARALKNVEAPVRLHRVL